MIEKLKTSDMTHEASERIIGASLVARDGISTFGISYTTSLGEGSAASVVLACTPEVWARVTKGTGNNHKHLRTGLTRSAEFKFVICMRPRSKDEPAFKGAKAGYEDKIVSEIICIPQPFYYGLDISKELNKEIYNRDEDAVVVLFHGICKGSFDVACYPYRKKSTLPQFIKSLENTDKIDYNNHIKCGNDYCEVESINGNEVIFRYRDGSKN